MLRTLRFAAAATLLFVSASASAQTAPIKGAAILTHPDGDHANGMLRVIERMDVKNVWMHQPWNHGNLGRLFSHDRVGLNGRRFKLYKIRSMVPGAEHMVIDLRDSNEADGPLFKIQDDPRVTSVGRILRGLSIDNLYNEIDSKEVPIMDGSSSAFVDAIDRKETKYPATLVATQSLFIDVQSKTPLPKTTNTVTRPRASSPRCPRIRSSSPARSAAIWR